ncbi:MAG: hypothetical protein K8T89_22975 [Planctomycetes bacterium]|nr:hypothetical protein [Planctomycetota bacterium]
MSAIVPVTPGWKLMLLVPPAAFESRIACRSEPAPASALVETVKSAAQADEEPSAMHPAARQERIDRRQERGRKIIGITN